VSGSTIQNEAKEKLSSGQLLRRLLLLALEYRRPCLAVVLMQVMLVALSLSTLGLTGLGIDYLQFCVLKNAETPSWPFGLTPPSSWSPMSVVALLSASIFVVAVLTAGLKYLAAVASGALSQQILIRIRTEIYEKLQVLSFSFYDAGESSSIINRAAGDANNVRNFIDGVIIRLITVVLTLTVYLIYMMQMHPMLTLACLATTPFLWASAVVFSAIVQPAYRRASELGDVMIRTLVENLQGIQVVKAFAREAEQARKFEAANYDIRDLKNSIFFRLSTFQPAMGMLTQINMLVLIGYGGSLVVRGELALGAGLFVFANLLHEFANQVAHITNIANSIQSSLSSAERVFEVLDQPVSIQSSVNAVALPCIRKHIQLERVSFGYRPDQLVLRDISLRIESGECLGVTGPTGAGKSTLISLLKRFYDVSSGALLFDGHDVRGLDLNDVRRASGIVFQESFLFSNTIAANIAFGNPDADDNAIRAAAVKAAAHEFISELPLKYETVVGEHGSNLSGGQRQRLALARALLTNPSLLLLDDATAAVDPETEHEIRLALESTMRGRTSVIVSNRLSTLRQTDRIVVLSAGRIEAVGTHDELLKTCEYYQSLATLQGISREQVPKRRRLAIA
jgi:ATP-binding cassette subfamily B protein